MSKSHSKRKKSNSKKRNYKRRRPSPKDQVNLHLYPVGDFVDFDKAIIDSLLVDELDMPLPKPPKLVRQNCETEPTVVYKYVFGETVPQEKFELPPSTVPTPPSSPVAPAIPSKPSVSQLLPEAKIKPPLQYLTPPPFSNILNPSYEFQLDDSTPSLKRVNAFEKLAHELLMCDRRSSEEFWRIFNRYFEGIVFTRDFSHMLTIEFFNRNRQIIEMLDACCVSYHHPVHRDKWIQTLVNNCEVLSYIK